MFGSLGSIIVPNYEYEGPFRLIRDDLLLDYDFQSAPEGVLPDLSGNGHDAALGAGAAAPTLGTTGATFDGGDYIRLADFPSDLTGISVLMAVNVTLASQYQRLLNTSETLGFDLVLNDSNNWAFNLRDGETIIFKSVAAIAGWQTIGFTADSETTRYFLNGAAVHEATSIGDWNNPGAALTIGARAGSSGSQGWRGTIARLVMHSSGLSEGDFLHNDAALRKILVPRGIKIE